MRLVKISKQKVDPETGVGLTRTEWDHTGTDEIQVPVLEDVVCELLSWGRMANNTDRGEIFYDDVVWLRRMDDNTVEFAYPAEIMFLDVVETK